MPLSIFNLRNKFLEFIQNYEGELNIKRNRAYHGDTLVAIYHKDIKL